MSDKLFRITEMWLEGIRTRAGGYTGEQQRLLGVPRLGKGWKRKLVGKSIPYGLKHDIEHARNIFASENRTKDELAKAELAGDLNYHTAKLSDADRALLERTLAAYHQHAADAQDEHFSVLTAYAAGLIRALARAGFVSK